MTQTGTVCRLQDDCYWLDTCIFKLRFIASDGSQSLLDVEKAGAFQVGRRGCLDGCHGRDAPRVSADGLEGFSEVAKILHHADQKLICN